jgi:hypothetical protein
MFFLIKNYILHFSGFPIRIPVYNDINKWQFRLFPKNIFIVIILLNVCGNGLQAQSPVIVDTAYERVIAGRTAKIVNTLEIKDAKSAQKVQNLLIQQYYTVNAIHENNKKLVESIKSGLLSKDSITSLLVAEEKRKAMALKQKHEQFIIAAKKLLTDPQLEKVKDGMTLGILPVTWKAYQEMLLQLTAEEKIKLYEWLAEARELAMDEGSSEKKHAVFGKYKGRINNYLSGRGYDMKKESADWAARVKEQNDKKQNKENL